MGVPLSAAVSLGLLFFLSVGLNEQVAEGCTCAAAHPQQLFCKSDIVIRAKITGKVDSTLPDLTGYGIKIIMTFKNVNKNIFRVIYSPIQFCGISLGNDQYLLSGHVQNGVVVVDLCDLVKLWDHVSPAEKKYLGIYEKGCACPISPCTGQSCLINMLQRKCLMKVKNVLEIDDEKALNSVCLQGSDGFCRWKNLYKSS